MLIRPRNNLCALRNGTGGALFRFGRSTLSFSSLQCLFGSPVPELKLGLFLKAGGCVQMRGRAGELHKAIGMTSIIRTSACIKLMRCLDSKVAATIRH